MSPSELKAAIQAREARWQSVRVRITYLFQSADMPKPEISVMMSVYGSEGGSLENALQEARELEINANYTFLRVLNVERVTDEDVEGDGIEGQEGRP